MGSPYDQRAVQGLQHAQHMQNVAVHEISYQGMLTPQQQAGHLGASAKGRKSLSASAAGIAARAPQVHGFSPTVSQQQQWHHIPQDGQHNPQQHAHQQLTAFLSSHDQSLVLQHLRQQEKQQHMQRGRPQHTAATHAVQNPLSSGQTHAALFQKPPPPQGNRKGRRLDKLQDIRAEEPRVEKNVPNLVDKLVPEAELYKRLLDVEELLDREGAKQAWQIDDALRDKPSLLRTLRISVCNTHKNQPAMRSNAPDKEAESTDAPREGAHIGADRIEGMSHGTPEWTLHILGDALGVEVGSQKLSDFLEKVL